MTTTAIDTEQNQLKIGGKVFHSRLIVGTGKYPSFEMNKQALEISGAEMVTVAVRRIELDKTKESILNYIDPDKLKKAVFLSWNTAFFNLIRELAFRCV